MARVRIFLAVLVIPGILAGCFPDRFPHRVGVYSRVVTMPHEWVLPGPGTEVRVFGPYPVEELKGFVRDMESSGWEVVGIEAASLPEDVMVDSSELDRPAKAKRPWSFDIPKTMDDTFDGPKLKIQLPDGNKVDSIPAYMEAVRQHRQKYIVTMRAWD